ncbi:MAG: peptide-methionine (S)-S-oxide reductase MsrA [bacterium]|nr:peptide-methionine (S)-S-oxide reductase MsrA [bacterium]
MTDQPADQPKTLETATFAGGCFWCIEAVLDRLEGVVDVESGYMGGNIDNPTYKQICTGTTNHAEVVQCKFDPSLVSFEQLVGYFFVMHDPTTLNRQGNDFGTQYRSAIFYHSDAQRQTAEAIIKKIQPKFDDRIVTEVTQASKFWPAEGYHQDYWEKNPSDRYCNAFIPSKLKKLGLER